MGKTNRVFKAKPMRDKDMKNIRPDRSCNNNGGCPMCEGDRTYSSKHRALINDASDIFIDSK